MNNAIKMVMGGTLLLFSASAEDNTGDSQCSEIHAEHILVETESQADEILQSINDGKVSFEGGSEKAISVSVWCSGRRFGLFWSRRNGEGIRRSGLCYSQRRNIEAGKNAVRLAYNQDNRQKINDMRISGNFF
jgi:hypothetical protein